MQSFNRAKYRYFHLLFINVINVNVSTILRWFGKVYLLKICSAQKLAESVSVSLIKIKSVLLKNWQKQSQGCVLLKIDRKSHGSSAPKIGRKSHGSSAQKMADTHTQTDTQTDRFHRYIVVRCYQYCSCRCHQYYKCYQYCSCRCYQYYRCYQYCSCRCYQYYRCYQYCSCRCY